MTTVDSLCTKQGHVPVEKDGNRTLRSNSITFSHCLGSKGLVPSIYLEEISEEEVNTLLVSYLIFSFNCCLNCPKDAY